MSQLDTNIWREKKENGKRVIVYKLRRIFVAFSKVALRLKLKT